MSFSFYPTSSGGRINIQVPDAVNKSQSERSPKIVSIQAYSKDSLWGKFKVLIGQAERFRDANGNEYILNMRSLGKALQLTEGKGEDEIDARTKMAAFKRFFPEGTPKTLEMVVEKCQIAAQFQAAQIHETTSLEPAPPMKAIGRNDISLCSEGISETIIEQLIEYINSKVKTNNSGIKILLYRPIGRVQPSIVLDALQKSGPQTALIFLNHINSNDVAFCSDEIRAKCKTFCSFTFWFEKLHHPAAIDSDLNFFLKSFE